MIPKLTSNIYDGIIDYKLCDVVPRLVQRKDDTEFNKVSSSKTVIMFSKLWNASENTTSGIASKIFWKLKPEYFRSPINPDIDHIIAETESIKYEAQIYRYITENIISTNVCPNFIGYMGYAECLVGQAGLPQFVTNKMVAIANADNLGRFLVNESVQASMEIGILLTYKPPNIEIYYQKLRWFLVNNEEKEFFKYFRDQVLFQIFYALFVMEKYKIMHNDLHINNIFIETLHQPTTITYRLGEYAFPIITKYIVYIYDWDRGYCEELERIEYYLHIVIILINVIILLKIKIYIHFYVHLNFFQIYRFMIKLLIIFLNVIFLIKTENTNPLFMKVK